MTDDPNDWLDDQLLTEDPPSTRGWRRRSVGGMSIADCLAGMPNRAQFQVRLPINGFRIFRAWCNQYGETMYGYTRRALIEKLERDPRWDPRYTNELRTSRDA